jgi:hypothetical protein
MKKGKIIACGLALTGGACIATGVGIAGVGVVSAVFNAVAGIGGISGPQVAGAVIGGGLGLCASTIAVFRSRSFSFKNNSAVMLGFFMVATGTIFGATGGSKIADWVTPSAKTVTVAAKSLPLTIEYQK